MSFLNDIRAKSILVVGDVMLDIYYDGEVKRISQEAPVPVFLKKGERSVLGGAANVVANLVASGQNVSLLTIIGQDEYGEKLNKMLLQKGINTDWVYALERNTTVKIRFMAENNQQVLRLDVEDTKELSGEVGEKLLNDLQKEIGNFDLILLSDYLKGLFAFDFTRRILQIAKDKGIPTFVDVKGTQFEKYRQAYLLKPNLKELHELTNMPVSNDEEIVEASEWLRQKCDCQYVITTCGARGMVLVGDGDPYCVASVGQAVFDVTGAGDTTIAYLASCMANGFSIRKSVDIANCAAGIQVTKAGTSVVYWREIRERLTALTGVHKLLRGTAVKEFRSVHCEKKIVFTNGCFDILHIGHIRYLQEAAKLGDILVLGLNSDMSVKRLKGPDRPINCEQDRAELLCALNFVNYVVIFDEDTPYELIKTIQPDILVKGSDYVDEYVVGIDIVENRGGKLMLIPFVEGKSTTNIIEKIKN